MCFFLMDTATTAIYTLSLHDALPISQEVREGEGDAGHDAGHDDPEHGPAELVAPEGAEAPSGATSRSEEHTSELQSQSNLVCRLLLEKKKTTGDLRLLTSR